MSLYRIKPLEWSPGGERGEWASPLLGNEYHVYNNGGWHWKVYGSFSESCDSLEAGKAACEAHWRAKLAEVLEEVPEDWQPIEAAPKDGTPILYAGYEWVRCGSWVEYEDGGWYQENTHPTDAWSEAEYPTHWMPLPKSPAGGPKEGK